MTVKELIKALEKYKGGELVILSSDSEGNSFSPLWELGAAQTDNYHNIIEEEGESGTPSVVLFPTT